VDAHRQVAAEVETPSSIVRHAIVQHGEITRLMLMVTPEGHGSFTDQANETLDAIRATLDKAPVPQDPIVQTVFLKDAADQSACERLFARHYRKAGPVTVFVHQPPCNGAALAIELCTIGGPAVRLGRPAPDTIAVSHHGISMTYCGGVASGCATGNVYEKSLDAFNQMKSKLHRAGIAFDRVVRTWLYLGDITGAEGDLERYMELNRARTDFYRDTPFCRGHLIADIQQDIYPASTGIGQDGTGIVMNCTAMDTQRGDVYLQPIENPNQTPVYHYESVYSPQSPKFSRAMALVADGAATVWVSGTASIVNSKTVYTDDPRGQTEQTIENIHALISADNLARHGIAGSGARLSDVAGLRVYVKHRKHYPVCRAVCEKHFGQVPILYTNAGVCRSDLLVEMEGIAYVRRATVD
jgi:enamine deaminase RidA (YjgF/YER057c/UK114 family)